MYTDCDLRVSDRFPHRVLCEGCGVVIHIAQEEIKPPYTYVVCPVCERIIRYIRPDL